MYKTLRIIFTVLSAICIAAAFPVFIFFKEIPGIICVVVALLFFVLMMLFKSLQEMNEPTSTTDAEISSDTQNENLENTEKNAVAIDSDENNEN